MKKQTCLICLVSGLAAAGAMAQETASSYYYFPEGAGPYFRLEAGPSFFRDGTVKTFGGPASGRVEYNTGGMMNLGFGYAFNQYVAAGLEVGLNGAKIDNAQGYFSDNSRIYNLPFMANVTLSCPLPRTIVTPYVGVGVGGSDAIFDTDGFSDGVDTVVGTEDDVVFAWQAYAGLRFQLSRHVSLGVGYKYFATGDPTFSYPPSPRFDVSFKGVQTHSVLASLQVDF